MQPRPDAATRPDCGDDSRGQILLVSHNFPPTQGPEASLVRLNTIDLSRRGWHLSVITTTMMHMHQRLDLKTLEGLPEGMEIMRTPSWEAVFRQRFPRLAGGVLRILMHVLPEIFLGWAFSAVPAGRSWLAHNPGAMIYSRATKHVSNVAGLYLKRHTGLPWVAHFSDPWLGYPMNPCQIRLGRMIERRIFREADAVVTVSRQLAAHFAEIHPEAASKIHVIPHGYEAELSGKATPAAGGRELRVIHAGSFMPGLREPLAFFAGLARLHRAGSLHGRIKVTMVGEDTRRYQPAGEALGIASLLDLRDSVPFHVCQDMIDKADLLLVLDTPGFGGVFLPTKLIEYLPFRKPVLGVTEHGSAVHDVLRESGQHFADIEDDRSIADTIGGLLERWEAGRWHEVCPGDQVTRYRIDNVNKSLDDLFLSLRAAQKRA